MSETQATTRKGIPWPVTGSRPPGVWAPRILIDARVEHADLVRLLDALDALKALTARQRARAAPGDEFTTGLAD